METWALIKTNRRVLAINFVISLVLAAGYIVDALKGRSPAIRVIMLMLPIVIQTVLCFTVYKRNNASAAFKYFGLVGFAAVYFVAIFASGTNFTYVIIFPYIVLYILYFDRRFMAVICAGTIISNIAKIVMQTAVYGHTAPDDVTQYTVQISAVVIICVSLYLITAHTIDINGDKLSRILESRKLLEDNAERLYENINEQAAKSESIIEVTDEIKDLSSEMTAIAESSSAALVSGMRSVAALAGESGKVNEGIGKVYGEIEQLNALAYDITNIVKIITKIAMNTNILALNASVEAARAGEHSKGFMSVAEEVIKLAAQSEESAKSISGIIDNLINKTSKTLAEVNSLRKNNDAQNEAVGGVKSAFGNIETENKSLAEKIRILDSDLNNLVRSNQDIGVSIQRIVEIAGRSKTLSP